MTNNTETTENKENWQFISRIVLKWGIKYLGNPRQMTFDVRKIFEIILIVNTIVTKFCSLILQKYISKS